MSIEFRVPELGENVASGDVVRVLVREGDVIEANDGVVELETEKAVVEIPCSYAGKVAKVHVAKGQTIKVGQTVLTIEAEVAVGREPKASAKPSEPVASPHPNGLSKKGTGSELKCEDPAKSTLREVPVPVFQQADSLAKGTGRTEGPIAPAGPLPAGPESRRLARELGVDLMHVRGTGRRGRITPEDVRAAAGFVAGKATMTAGSPHPTPLPTSLRSVPGEGVMPGVPLGDAGRDAYGPVRRERMSRIRRTIAAQMVKSASTIPHVTNFDDADVTDLEHLRKSVPESYLGPEVKLTALPLVIKAVALSLREHPVMNASLDEEKEEVVYKGYVNVGVAVDTPRGLVVPVLRNVDQMGVPQIARELATLATRARAASFALEEVRGGTFTISNLGAVGGAYSTPIINHPEVGILLLGRSRPRLALVEGKAEPRLMMPLSLSFDHRVVDGAAASRFLNRVIDYLQMPGKLLLTT